MRNLNKIKMKYEFKLDSRQIVLIFVGFLMVALGVFAAGVSTGKQLAKVTGTPQEENLLEELQEKEKQLDEAQEVLTKQQEKEAEEKIEPQEEKKLPETKKEKSPEKKQIVQKEEKKEKPKPEPKPEPKKEQKKSPKKTETAQNKKAAEKKSEASTSKVPTGRYYTLQVASLPTMDKAKEYIKTEFKAFDKRKPFITPVAIADRGTWYRVKIGKFDTKEQAMAYQSIFEARTEMQTMLVLENN